MNLEYKEKYLKYKAKYLELKNNLIGGTIEDVNRILEISEYNYEQIFRKLHGEINFDNEDEINKAYRKMALKVAPDKFSNTDTFSDIDRKRAEAAFKKLNNARDKLIENIASQNEGTRLERERLERERLERERLEREREERERLERERERLEREILEREEIFEREFYKRLGEKITKKEIDKYININVTDTTINQDIYILEQIKILVNHRDISISDDLFKLGNKSSEIIKKYKNTSDEQPELIKYAEKHFRDIHHTIRGRQGS